MSPGSHGDDKDWLAESYARREALISDPETLLEICSAHQELCRTRKQKRMRKGWGLVLLKQDQLWSNRST